MSVSAPEGQSAEPESVLLSAQGGPAFAALMDALAPEPDEAPAGEGGAAAAAPAAGDGSPAAGDQGAAAADAAAGAPAAGDGGQPAVPPATPGGAGGDAAAATGQSGEAPAAGAEAVVPAEPPAGGELPADWTADPADFAPALGQLSVALEQRAAEGFQATALEEVKTEYKPYFEAVTAHPRTLVGRTVPRADGQEGTETLRDSADAQEWQEAIKQMLTAEINARTAKAMEDNSGILNTVHASLDLFKNNPELIPGTKKFDVELANRVTTLLEPYEVREGGKFHGYAIPTQPIINQLKAQIAAERAAKAAAATGAPPAPGQAAGAPAAPATQAAAPPAAPAPEPPQTAIQSKAGSGEHPEDFGDLFATIHPALRDMRI